MFRSSSLIGRHVAATEIRTWELNLRAACTADFVVKLEQSAIELGAALPTDNGHDVFDDTPMMGGMPRGCA
ncbi:MAG: hypothetical protein ACWGMZ_13430 [Thermoguttaceae bacterium]